MPIDPITIAALVSAGGGLIDRFISRGDIAKQNAYNSPTQQVARLKEAGLPMAALTGGVAGNQSQLPEGAGFKEAVSKYQSTSMQGKQLEILKAEARLKNAQADESEARRDWLLGQVNDTSLDMSNLTNQLRTSQNLQTSQLQGQSFANTISSFAARNASMKTLLENQTAIQNLARGLQGMGLVNKEIEGKELDNKIKDVVAQYQPGMSLEQFKHLVKSNNLLDVQIEGSNLDNEMKRIKNFIEEQTKHQQIHKIHMDDLQSVLNYERFGAEFKNYKEYQLFVDEVRRQFRGQNGFMSMDSFRALAALAYTTITGLSGSANVGNIMMGLR